MKRPLHELAAIARGEQPEPANLTPSDANALAQMRWIIREVQTRPRRAAAGTMDARGTGCR